MPELPDKTRQRLENTYGLAAREVDILVRLGDTDQGEIGQGVKYFEEVVQARNPKVVANWYANNVQDTSGLL